MVQGGWGQRGISGGVPLTGVRVDVKSPLSALGVLHFPPGQKERRLETVMQVVESIRLILEWIAAAIVKALTPRPPISSKIDRAVVEWERWSMGTSY